MLPPDDQEVVSFLRGDAASIADLRHAIDQVVGRFDRLRSERADLTQEALVRAFLGVRSGRFRGDASLATYARRIARYTCLEALRRRRMETEIDLDARPSGRPGPEESLLRSERLRRGLRLLSTLSPECRQLFGMIFVEGLSYRQVAERLAISEGAVKLRVLRCRLAGRQEDGKDAVDGKKILPKPAGPAGH